MRLKKDMALSHDIIVKKGSGVKGDAPLWEGPRTSGLVKVTLIRDYPIKGLVIETSSVIEVGEMRVAQLAQAGFCKSRVDGRKAAKKRAKKEGRIRKEDAPERIIVEHKIEEDGSNDDSN